MQLITAIKQQKSLPVGRLKVMIDYSSVGGATGAVGI